MPRKAPSQMLQERARVLMSLIHVDPCNPNLSYLFVHESLKGSSAKRSAPEDVTRLHEARDQGRRSEREKISADPSKRRVRFLTRGRSICDLPAEEPLNSEIMDYGRLQESEVC